MRGWRTAALWPCGDRGNEPDALALRKQALRHQQGLPRLEAVAGPIPPPYDTDWIRNELEKMGIQPCIRGRPHRKRKIDFDEDLYKTRHRIENAFAKLKDWRHVALRVHGCPKIFLGVVTFAVIVKFWL